MLFKIKNVLALATATILLAGCAGAGTPAAKPTEKPTTQATDAPAAKATDAPPAATEASTTAELKPAELTWYFVVPGPQPEQDLVYEEFNKKLQEKINATVNFTPIPFGDYDQKLKVTIAAGEDYDICFTSNWTNNYGLNAAKGAFAPLDELLPQYAPKLYAQVPKDFWEATKINGKIYGVVNEQISARGPAYAINAEAAKKFSFDTATLKPYDLSSVEPFIAAAKKEDAKYFVSANLDDPAYFKQDFLAGWNIPGSVYVDDTSLKIMNQFESKEVVQFVDLMRDFNAKGYTNGEERISMKVSDEEARKGFGIASIDGAYKPGIEVAALQRFGVEMTYVQCGDPILSTSGICATLQAINRNSKNPERSMMLLEIMNTDQEMYNLLNFGIIDKHFKLNSEGFMVKTDETPKYSPYVPWMFATNYLAYVDEGMPKDVWQQTRRMNADAKRSPLLGFAFDLEPVKSEAGQCSAVVDEYAKTLEMGLASKEKYTEFLNKLKEAGSEKVIAEMQKQVDAWKATR